MNNSNAETNANIIKEIITEQNVLSPVEGEEGSVRIIECLTECVSKYESPKAREGREKKEGSDRAQRHWVERARIVISAVVLLVFLALAVYLFGLKPDSTEAQRTFAAGILSAIVGGGAVYAFGKKGSAQQGED